MIKRKILFPIIILLVFSQIFTGQSRSFGGPTYEEMQLLRNKIEALVAIPNKPVNEEEAQRIINSFRQRFGKLEFLSRRRPGPAATSEYNALLNEVNATEQSWKPSITAPTDAELNSLQNKINQSKSLAQLKRTNNFDQRISNVENRKRELNRLVRRNRNEEARNLYTQLNSEIDAVILELNSFKPPRDKIKRSRTVSDRQETISTVTTYTKNVSGTVIHAFEFGNFKFNIDLSKPVASADLRITGSKNMYEQNFRARIHVNGKQVRVDRATFSTQRGTWVVSIPVTLLQTGRNNIRLIVARPKNNRRFSLNIDELQLILHHRN